MGNILAEPRFHVLTATGGIVLIAVIWIWIKFTVFKTIWCQHDVDCNSMIMVYQVSYYLGKRFWLIHFVYVQKYFTLMPRAIQ